jgi:hypothetical protein
LLFRINNTKLVPTYLIETAADKTKDRKWFKQNDLIAIQAAYTDHPLGYAWLEIYFSEILNVNFNICTFCGETFSLKGKRGNGLNKTTCGGQNCKKTLRRQTDERNRLIYGEEIKKKDLERKHKSLAYREIVLEQKTTVPEFAKRINMPSNVVQQWINDRLVREKQKDAKKRKLQS